jgi:hypothetical protein
MWKNIGSGFWVLLTMKKSIECNVDMSPCFFFLLDNWYLLDCLGFIHGLDDQISNVIWHLIIRDSCMLWNPIPPSIDLLASQFYTWCSSLVFVLLCSFCFWVLLVSVLNVADNSILDRRNWWLKLIFQYFLWSEKKDNPSSCGRE